MDHMKDYDGLTRDERLRLAMARAHNVKPTDPWFYLSFADGKFLGACVLQAPDAASAPARAHLLGINPGGEVAIWDVGPTCPVAPEDINRLLNRAEAEGLKRVQAQTDAGRGLSPSDPEAKKGL